MTLSRFFWMGMVGVGLALVACGGEPAARTTTLPASETAPLGTVTAPPATVTQPVTATSGLVRPTATAAPQTREPTPTDRPIATAYPPLQTEGPYFTYWKLVNGQTVLVRLDADGRGRSDIGVEAIHVWPGAGAAGSLAPSGEWVAG